MLSVGIAAPVAGVLSAAAGAGATPSRDSASSRKLARTATRSPAATPRTIWTLPPLRSPVSTSRGSSLPGAVSTKTVRRRPESSTAEEGTRTPGPRSMPSSTSTNIPGRSAKPGLGSSKRAVRVRAAASRVG